VDIEPVLVDGRRFDGQQPGSKIPQLLIVQCFPEQQYAEPGIDGFAGGFDIVAVPETCMSAGP